MASLTTPVVTGSLTVSPAYAAAVASAITLATTARDNVAAAEAAANAATAAVGSITAALLSGTIATGSGSGTISASLTAQIQYASSTASQVAQQVSALTPQVTAAGSAAAAAQAAVGSYTSQIQAATTTANAASSAVGSYTNQIQAVTTTANAASTSAGSATTAVATLSQTVGSYNARITAATNGLITSSAVSGSLVNLINAAGGVVTSFAPPGGSGGGSSPLTIGTVSTTGSTGTLTITNNILSAVFPSGAQGTQGIQGPAGTVAAGGIGSNVAASFSGGADKPLNVILDRIRSTDYFGTTHNNVSIQSTLGVTTRAALAAYTNTAGQTPYAFMSYYPVSTNDDVQIFAPANITSGTTMNLASTLALPTNSNGLSGLYQSTDDGYWYVYTAGTPSTTYCAGMYVTDSGGKLAANTRVLSTFSNCIRITAQQSGTAISSGSTLTFGPLMSQITTGKQIWAPQGIQPGTMITAVNGTTITISKALVTGTTNSYGDNINGVFALSQMRVFTPVAETNICSSMNMDTLAIAAAYFNCRSDNASNDTVYLSRGDHVISNPLFLWGRSCNIFGDGAQTTYLRCAMSNNGFAVMSIMPKLCTIFEIGSFSVRPFSGTQLAGVYIEGSNERAPTLNNVPGDNVMTVNIKDMAGSGGFSVGALQLLRMRHIGGCWIRNVTYAGPGYTLAAAPSCTVSVQNVVAVHFKNVGGAQLYAVILQEGYCEHITLEDVGDVSCACVFDGDLASTLPGSNVGCLIWELRGGDIDWQYFGYRVCYAQSVIISGSEFQMPNALAAVVGYGVSTGAVFALNGCQNGHIVAMTGGSGSSQVDAIQLNRRNLDGAAYGTNGMLIGFINSTGFASAVRIASGCNGNTLDTNTILLNGSTSNAIIDSGTNTHIVNSNSNTTSTATSLASDTYFNGYFKGASVNVPAGTSGVAIPIAVDDDSGGNTTGSGTANFKYSAKRNGHYRMRLTVGFLATGTAANSSTGAPAAPPAGTNIGACVGTPFDANPVIYVPSSPGANFVTTFTDLYLGAGTSIGLNAYCDVANAINFASVSIEQVG